MNPPRWPIILLSVILGLVGLSLLLGGAAVVTAQQVLRDANGAFGSPTYRVSTTSDAVVLDNVDLDNAPTLQPGRWQPTVRIAAQGTGDRPVFVGIAAQSKIDTYLAGVAHERVTDVRRTHLDTRPVAGAARAGRPTNQSFWAASAAGTGRQEITWPAHEGRWAVVVMNADATPAVNVTTTAAVHIPYLTEAAVLTLVVGVLALLGCITAVLWVGPEIFPRVSPGLPDQDRGFPLRLTAERDPVPSRWLWVMKWVLVIPHLLVLTGLWAAFIVLTLVAGATILFTGRYPRRIFDFNVAVLAWTWRVGHYSYLTLGTDHYPPFNLTAPAYPASLDIAYPGRLSRGLVLVKWLLAVPHLIVLALLTGSTSAIGLFGTGSSSTPFPTGLIGLLVVVAAGHLVLLRRYPQGLFDLLLGLNRWLFRTITYLALMTDTYPPFRLDLDEKTPQASTPPADPATAVMAAELVGSPN